MVENLGTVCLTVTTYGDPDTSVLMWTTEEHKWLYEILKLFPTTFVMATSKVERKRSLKV